MKVGHVELPCGCEDRKQTMFIKGGAGALEISVLLGVPLGLLVYFVLVKGKA